jgi:2,3-bisphosphoglycerate-dependent phosphoglycerate mutase
MPAMSRLTLLRHGQSVWNQENRFTGFVDVELSELGKKEAQNAGLVLKGMPLDVVFVSALKRAQDTADLALDVCGKKELPRVTNAALNERHYGDLQGLNKDEVRKQYGAEQVHIWRRSFDIAPPGGESLKQTCERVIPYYRQVILPRLKQGENVLIVAHGNSLRGLLMELEKLSEKEIVDVEIPTGVPISFEIDKNGIAHNKVIMNRKENL